MGVRLLIIDDDENVLNALNQYFSRKNYLVRTATCALEALKLFNDPKQVPDLIITDIVLPNISGVALISMVRKKHPHIPIIAITGWGEHPQAMAMEARADLVLRKPMELEELEIHVKQLLASS